MTLPVNATYFDADGRVVGYVFGPPEDVTANLPDGARWIEGEYQVETHWLPPAGGVLERPAAEILDLVSLPDGTMQLDLSSLVPGMVLTATNEDGDTLAITEFSEPLILRDAGYYHIHIEAVFPFISTHQEIVV